MLGRKQSISNNDWIKALADIKATVPKSHIDKLAKETVAEIKAMTEGKKVAYGWSGGKDSIVLGVLCEKAKITACMLGATKGLEYPAFMAWVENNKPAGLEIVQTKHDMAWLAANPDMLFPDAGKRDPKTRKRASLLQNRWFAIVQHWAQTKYFKDKGLDILLVGRRRADGNYTGKGGNIYTNNNGVTRYSPLASWRHEDLLAYVAYYDLPMPPIYEWPNGFKCGTHPWPARQHIGSYENGWQEISSIDPTLIEEAAKADIMSAIKFLEVGNDNQRKAGKSDTGGK